jgi:hypothetical protein
MAYFQVDNTEDDEILYFESDCLEDAQEKFRMIIDDVPNEYVSWSEIAELPEDAELI